jgi:mono/diheme cytochrome c family protein
MKNVNRILLVLALAALVALAPALWANGNGDAGKALYDKKCASCHAKDGAGNPAIAKAMKVELRHLGSKEVQAKSDADLKKDTVEGVGKMKGIKLTDAEWADVLAYMRTLKQK